MVSDDITLSPGGIRIRKKGSAGGHNGLKNIIGQLGTENFKRIRIGVGEKPKGYDLADYVLGHFSKEEQPLMQEGDYKGDGSIKSDSCRKYGSGDERIQSQGEVNEHIARATMGNQRI